jgi:hypothetical protein
MRKGRTKQVAAPSDPPLPTKKKDELPPKPDPQPFKTYTVWDGPTKHEVRAQNRYQVDHGYILSTTDWRWSPYRKEWDTTNVRTVAFIPKTCIIIPGEDEDDNGRGPTRAE